MWEPSPSASLPDVIRLKGVSIGDVGIVGDDGYFDRLFNICCPADSAENYNGVPEGFEQVKLGADEDQRFHPYHHGTHTKIVSAGVQTIVVNGEQDTSLGQDKLF